MRPLPPFALASYPIGGPFQHPSRPWWHLVDLADKERNPRFDVYVYPRTGWRRIDGKELQTHRYKVDHEEPIAGLDVEAKLAEIDRASPLPHPGFRCGQIWAQNGGASVSVVAVDLGVPLVCWYERLGESVARRGLVELPDTFTFLIFDPACPKLAPWSAAEGV